MKTYLNFIVNNPKLVLTLVLLLTLMLGSGLTRLEINNNQESDLPEDDEIVQTNKRLEAVFGDKAVLMIGLEHPESIYNLNTLQKVQALSEEIKSIPFVIDDEVTSLSTFNNLKARDWGLERAPFLKKIPQNQKDLTQLRQDVEASEEVSGRLVSKDNTFTVVIANIEENFDQATVANAVFELVERFQGPEKIYVVGDAIQAQEIDGGIQQDVSVLLPTALGLIVICFFLCLRTLRGVLLPFSLVLLSILWTMGSMGWLGLPVTVVSSALPALMVAVASSYGIHVMLHYYDSVESRESRQQIVATALEKVAPAVLMTGITSVIGAMTLVIFKVSSIQEFGFATSIGILSATCLSLTFIPAVLMLLKEKKAKHSEMLDSKLDQALESMTLWVYTHKVKTLVIAFSCLSLLAFFGLNSLRVGQDFVKYFDEDHRLRIAFEKFNNKLGGARYMDVMLVGDEPNTMEQPELLKVVEAFQDYAEAMPEVGYTNSFADVISSINSALHDNKPEKRKIPNTEEEIAQYLLLYSMSGDPSSQSDLVDYDHQRVKIRIMLTTSEQDDHKRLLENFKNWTQTHVPDTVKVEFGGEVLFWLAQIRYIVLGKVQNIILSALAVLIFCSLIFKSLTGGLLSILPLTVSTILTLSFMGILGLRLDVGTAIITAIGVGIGVDFSLHYLKRLIAIATNAANQIALSTAMILTAKTSGKAIIFDTISNVAGFSVFILSGFQPLQFFGWLISLMMISSALGAILLFPPVIALFARKFIYSQSIKPTQASTDTHLKNKNLKASTVN